MKLVPFLILIKTILIFLAFSSSAFSQYKLTPINEFQINSLNDIDILDYSPVSKMYLGYMKSGQGERILLIDNTGEMVANKILKGEGPNQYVTNLNCMAFSEDGNIWLQTVTHLYLYDQSLSVIERTPFESTLNIQLYGKKEAFSYFSGDNQKSTYSFITNPSGSNSYIPNSKSNNELIEIYNPDKKELYRIASVSDRLIANKLDASMKSSLYFIVYSVDRKSHRLFLTTRLDDEITVYNLLTRQLESKVKIKHEKFDILNLNSISVKDLKSDGRESLNPRNHKIFSLDGNLAVLDYVTEIPFGIYQQKKADDPSYTHLQDSQYHKLILFNSEKQLSGDIKMPKNGKLMASLQGNQLLFKIVDPDVEEDFITYRVYKIEIE